MAISTDPGQTFRVGYQECLKLHVQVCSGRNIVHNSVIMDKMLSPEPYVSLNISNAVEGCKKTAAIKHEKNPEWNESFDFYLDSRQQNILEVALINHNKVMDTKIAKAFYRVSDLTPGIWVSWTCNFNGVSEVDFRLLLEFVKPELRYSQELCEEEARFIHSRKDHVLRAMKATFAASKVVPLTVEEVPIVGVLGSGGGFRAMIGLSGVFKALWDTGLLDCVMYAAGLSGSTWYLSQLYSHPDWPNISPGDQIEELKNNVRKSTMGKIKDHNFILEGENETLAKARAGQPVSLTDIYGRYLGETLLKGRYNAKLSEQRQKVKGGQSPLPIYTAISVKKDVDARVYHDWVEFTPYEIGIPRYGVFMKVEDFGCKFSSGKVCNRFPEQPLHYMQGIWGNAFAIMWSRLLKGDKEMDKWWHANTANQETVRHNVAKELVGATYGEEIDSDQEEETGLRRPLSDLSSKFKKHKSAATRKVLEWLVHNPKLPHLSTVMGRAATIFNPLRSLDLHEIGESVSGNRSSFAQSNKSKRSSSSCTVDLFTDIDTILSCKDKNLYLVDAGLAFNSPYPPLLRPQRHLDILLSFDFSLRPHDNSSPFEELLVAARWAKVNHVPFPPINTEQHGREEMKTLYIFRHPTDDSCPIVLHFVLHNDLFKKYKAPGVVRETTEETKFASFRLFGSPKTPYDTYNFDYSFLDTERLHKLTEFNTLHHLGDIKRAMTDCVSVKRSRLERHRQSGTSTKSGGSMSTGTGSGTRTTSMSKM